MGNFGAVFSDDGADFPNDRADFLNDRARRVPSRPLAAIRERAKQVRVLALGHLANLVEQQIRPHAVDAAAQRSGFLNRWSEVRVSPGERQNKLGPAADPASVDQTWAKTAELAELFLRACAAGAPCADLATALAESVLEDAGVKLALEVLDGGEHRHARATELASRVLDAAAVAARDPKKANGGGGG